MMSAITALTKKMTSATSRSTYQIHLYSLICTTTNLTEMLGSLASQEGTMPNMPQTGVEVAAAATTKKWKRDVLNRFTWLLVRKEKLIFR